MTALEHTIYGLRRGFTASATFLFAGAFAAAFAVGAFQSARGGFWGEAGPIALFALWVLAFGVKAHRRFVLGRGARAAVQARTDLELGLLLVVGTHAIVQLAGGLDSLLYPIVFVLIAFLVVYTPQWVGFALVTAAIGLEFAPVLLDPAHRNLAAVVVHSIFIVFFALINLVFTRTEVARMRRRTELEVEQAKTALANDARAFRLTAPARGAGAALTRAEEEERLSRASVSEVRSSMFHHVELLKRSLRLHTCAVFWLDTLGEKLRILECVSEADNITARRLDRGEGVLGGILQSGRSLKLTGLKPGYPGLPYYEGGSKVTDFAGIPILEHGTLRGVLGADRVNGAPFEDSEVDALATCVESLLRLVANERVFTQLQKAKSEQGKLLLASESLSQALAEKDVVKAALAAAAQIARFDLAAVALVNESGRQIIRAATGEAEPDLRGLVVSGGSSLAAAALKTRHPLPYRGELDPRQQIVFTKKSQKVFAKMRAAVVLPLVSGETPLGTLTLAASAPGAFDEEVRTTLQVMTNQLAVALSNARMVKRLEELATTDGLTSLPNHRVFQEELEKKLASATRFNKELSIILCDVDKFKNVNDTYGHPVGDVVLRGLGETLRRNVVRETDLPARYGGEEFAVLCEGTDTHGAVKLAERIRKDLESQIFHTDKGDLRVTISMGVATFPVHARAKADLVERADAALYAAKQGGRNQVRIWSKDQAQA